MSKLIFSTFSLITVACVLALPKRDRPNVRIVGGNDTDITLHPWQVSIRRYNSHQCGGVLISNKWLLTAAHCVYYDEPEKINVIVGSTYLSTGGEKYNVSQIIMHEEYKFNDYYDIALLELTEAVNNPNASAVDLPTKDDKLAPGANIIVTGWGTGDAIFGGLSEVLQEVVVPIVSQKDCAKAYRFKTMPDQVLCAGYLGIGGKDACYGDSGGPGVAEGKVYGLVSQGAGCAEPKFPGIYTDVIYFLSWIKNITGIY